MDRTRVRHVSTSETNDVSATFLLSHFRSFLFPLRFWSRNFSFPFDCEINVSEILPSRTIKVNKSKFTFEIAPSLALVTLQTVRCARLPLLSIVSDKDRREY